MITNDFFRNVEKSHVQLVSELENINRDHGDLSVVAECCLIEIDEAIRKLKALVISYRFESVAEEVFFFKNLKPKFISEYLYYSQVLNIESAKPLSGKTSLKKFYRDRLQKYNKVYEADNDFYNYVRRKATYLDHKYFVRNAYDLKMKLPDYLYSFDEGFTTSYDHQVAVFMANEKIISFLIAQLQELDRNEITKMQQSKKLQWTASKVSLAELIYALHKSRCINGGSLDLSETIKIFQTLLNINLSNFHKVIGEIKSRKSNRTKFLQHLQDNLNNVFLEDDE
ncbi:RteC domain-containing protein [Chryseobacterium koreense]